jgi:hypothetical protein
MSELILYTTKDCQSRIQLRADSHTVWLTQLEMDGEQFSALLKSIGEVTEAEAQE